MNDINTKSPVISNTYGEGKPTYYVFATGGRAPSRKHHSRIRAEREAERLSTLNPGVHFHVCKLKRSLITQPAPAATPSLTIDEFMAERGIPHMFADQGNESEPLSLDDMVERLLGGWNDAPPSKPEFVPIRSFAALLAAVFGQSESGGEDKPAEYTAGETAEIAAHAERVATIPLDAEVIIIIDDGNTFTYGWAGKGVMKGMIADDPEHVLIGVTADDGPKDVKPHVSRVFTTEQFEEMHGAPIAFA